MAKKTKDEEQDEATSDGSIPVNDAWTGMLAISLLALLIGTGFLAWDWYLYSDQDLPKVPKFSGSTPQKPLEPTKPSDKGIEKKDDGGVKDVEKKDDIKKDDVKKDDKQPEEKKDAMLRRLDELHGAPVIAIVSSGSRYEPALATRRDAWLE